MIVNFYGLVIKDKQGKIIALARESFRGELIFGTLDETPNFKKVALFDEEGEAKRSFT